MKRLRYWWPAIAWAAVVWTFSTEFFGADYTSRYLVPLLRWLLPGASADTIALAHGAIRKAGHVAEYFILSLLVLRAIRAERAGWQLTWGLTALALAVGWAALDEVHQAFVHGRGGSPPDVLRDGLGAAAAQVAAWWWASRQAKKTLAHAQGTR